MKVFFIKNNEKPSIYILKHIKSERKVYTRKVH